MQNNTIHSKKSFAPTLIAFALVPISGLATDIYLPSMPQMAQELGLAESNIQLTLSLFLISYGIAQFFTGALVDAWGRYRITLISLFLFTLSFWVTATTDNILVIYLMRILQGILSAFVVVSKRAYFVDVYEGEERKRYLSAITIVWSLAPIIAPFIGGYLQAQFGWRSNFMLLAAYSAILFVLELIFSAETIRKKNPLQLNYLVTEFKTMLQTKDFTFGVLMCGISYGLVMFYNLSGPFFIEHNLGFSSITTGYISLLMGLAWMSGGFIGRALIQKSLLPKLQMANYLQIGFIVVMILISPYATNIYTLSLFAFLIHVTAGFIFNNYFGYCLGRFPSSAGIAGGLAGGITYLVTSALSYIVVSLVNPDTQTEIGIGYAIFAFLGFVTLIIIKLKKAYKQWV
ncbi:MFS transporter [Sphingobacterium faecium]|jgi:multidrug resistance protein|uniref:MFS transporter n=1 Tax=Sphingobacterium faecium TaxID=34087 RepID=UPI00097ED45C|nr:MFS transporter [Sphingobacterium faecium]PTX11996.1 multidrug resistance protein [Sphingobacterium faecium]WGQ13919.1 MFS transporter [Sphingobacterium faecium]GEM63238.1 Bcr/CflA family drug resistance efflux transporter [Sphingobacterium faecium NBRC 15299]SJN46203.1 drug resistance transporter, Bcr/CflA subfamily [Sphingobacterium faecium PCAi_F2.5]